MLTVGKVKAGTSEVKSPLEIGFTPNFKTGQFSEVTLYWFSPPGIESSEVILTDPNGVVVFTSDKTGENSEVFISDVIGTYTATITAIFIPGGDAKTKEDVLHVDEGEIPYINVYGEPHGTSQLENDFFKPNTALNLDTKFSWYLSSNSGPMSFLIEISDPDGEIIHSVSGDDVLEEGSHFCNPEMLGEYTITATATNPVGTSTETETILCESWPQLLTEASLWPSMYGFGWNPEPDRNSVCSPRMSSKWGWWFELSDCYNPGMKYNGVPTGEPDLDPYRVDFKYRTGGATEAKIEFIDPDGLVDCTKDKLKLTFADNKEKEVNFGFSYFPRKRGVYTARLTLSSSGFIDPAIVECDIPCFDNLEDKENAPEISFNPHTTQEYSTFTLVWDAKGGKEVAVEWKDSEGNVGTSSSDTGSVEFVGVLGEYTASITCKLGGHFRNEDARIDVVEYQEPIPSITFSSSHPMMDCHFSIRWDSRSQFPGRTAVVEWKDPDGIVLGTYTGLVGSSEKIIVEKSGTYSARIDVTTPEGLVVNSSISALSVPYVYVKPTFNLRGDGLTFKHYTQLKGTGRTENGII